jgi:hypothetical protein
VCDNYLVHSTWRFTVSYKFEDSLITSPEQLTDGPHIEVWNVDGRLFFRTVTLVGVPYVPKEFKHARQIQNLFVDVITRDSTRTRISLEDKNVVPNTYNTNTLWQFSQETLDRLQAMEDNGPQGIGEYLLILKRHGRGIEY